MTTPVWVLLGFAGWTVLTLLATVGWYRWSRILTGRAELKEFLEIPINALTKGIYGINR
jgi:hypothetical protein